MSGIKPIALTHFYRRLHARERGPRTVDALARKLLLNRQHLTEVLNGTRCGRRTWPRLARVLTPDELRLLGRDRRGELLEVPRETMSQLRQFTEGAA